MIKKLLPLFLLLAVFSGFAQTLVTTPDGREVYVVACIIVDGDTVPEVSLRPYTVFEPITFRNKREQRHYTRLVRYVKKVYPYARLAADKLRFYEDTLQKIDDPRARKVMMRHVEAEIRAEFEDELKKLTFTQGTILIKLIDRETGHTSFEILKDLRGRLIAGFWQSLGRLFGYNLKKRYDPDGSDWQIEYIVRQIEAGVL